MLHVRARENDQTVNIGFGTSVKALCSRIFSLRQVEERKGTVHPMRAQMHHRHRKCRGLQDAEEHRRKTLHAHLRRRECNREPADRNQAVLSLLARIHGSDLLDLVMQLRLPMVPEPQTLSDRARP
jgi:hypothetical protein